MHVDVAAVVFDRAPDHRHAQTRAASSHHLLGEERLEDFAQIPGRYPDAGILDRQYDIFAFANVIVERSGGFDVLLLGGQVNSAFAGNGFGGIGNQVHDGFGQMHGGTVDVGQIGRKAWSL